MTLAAAELVPGDGRYARVRLGDGAEVETRVPRSELPAGGTLQVGLRPESVTVAADGAATTQAKVELVERLGERTLVYARLSDGAAITAEDEGYSRVQVGETIGLRIRGEAAHLFDADERGYHAEAQPA
jgi:multiple sugar transport system ATP-binding protein